jgi:hypothetical protein
MSGNWLDDFVQTAQRDVIGELQTLVEEKGIKMRVLQEAQDLAKIAARHILDETQPDLEPFPKIPIESEEQLLQYQIVLEFLQSAGFKFAPSVLRFESQHPEVELDRRTLGIESQSRTQLRFARTVSQRTFHCLFDRTPSFISLCVCPFIHLFIHLFIHSFIRFTNWPES